MSKVKLSRLARNRRENGGESTFVKTRSGARATGNLGQDARHLFGLASDRSDISATDEFAPGIEYPVGKTE